MHLDGVQQGVSATLVLHAGAARAVAAQPYRRAERDARARQLQRLVGQLSTEQLIWRVFLQDVLACAGCSGRMQMVAAVTSPASIVQILANMGLPTAAPAIHPPRPPPQEELPFDACGFEPDPPAPDDFDA